MSNDDVAKSPDEVRFPASPFGHRSRFEDLKTDIEHDPEGAEELVALIRALRHEGSRKLSL
jgi:hypothetical protein